MNKKEIKEHIAKLENELKQVETEFHKRVGKLELLKEMLDENKEENKDNS